MSPSTASCAALLDRIHRRFLKWLSFKMDGVFPKQGTSQTELLARHNFKSLACRRNRFEAEFARKLLHGIIDAPELLERLPLHVPRLSTRTNAIFYLGAARTNVRKYSPISRILRAANAYFDDIFILCEHLYFVCVSVSV